MGMSAILGMWPKYFVYILATLSKGVFIWNLSLIGLMVSEKICFLIYWWRSNMSDLKWKVKGQPWPLGLIYSHCPIRLNKSSDYNDFGFNIFKKSTFLKISHLKASGSKFDLDVK